MKTLLQKVEDQVVFDPITLSIVRTFHPTFDPTSLETFSWLHLLSWLAFQDGDTALSMEYEDLTHRIKTLFHDENALDDHEVDYITNCCFQEMGFKSHHYHDTIFGRFLLFPFSQQHDRVIVENLHRLMSVKRRGDKGDNTFLYAIDRLHEELLADRCNEEQKKAIQSCLESPFSIIYGGPGTGKTYTAGALITWLCHLFYVKQQQSRTQYAREPYRILITAPTGKAVFTLKKSIETSFKKSYEQLSLPIDALHIEAMTLHSFFLMQKRSGQEMSYHTIIVDESSMIDSELMARFLSQVHTGVRIIMMGDPNQLPPIRAGQPFSDIIEAFHLLKREDIPCSISSLSVCMRAELQGIIALADAVLQKNSDSFFEVEQQNNSGNGIQFIDDVDQKTLFPLLYNAVAFPWEKSSSFSIEEAIEISTQAKILSPIRDQGSINVNSINRMLSSALTKNRVETYRYLTPILITKNRYDISAMNGDIGVCETFKNGCRKQIYLPNNPNPVIPESLCPDYEMNYAMSVHKSQGSEFQKVLLLLPEKSSLLTLPLLYTAITRAKKEITLIGKREVIKALFQDKKSRRTGLVYQIYEQIRSL